LRVGRVAYRAWRGVLLSGVAALDLVAFSCAGRR